MLVVDDLYPCFDAGEGAAGGCVFTASSRADAQWPQVLEKACAKLFGSYAQLREGWALEALVTLTGAPCEAARSRRSVFEIREIENLCCVFV